MSEPETPTPQVPVEPAAAPEPAPEPIDSSANDAAVDREIARKTRRSLFVGGLAALAGGGVWEWLRTRRNEEGVPWPLRLALRTDEELSRDYFKQARLARTFSAGDVEELRENGDIGLDDDVSPDWKLVVEGVGQPLTLTMDDLKALPKVEQITQFKCIEGWSHVWKFGGVRFRDFARKYAPGATDPNSYVALETPGREYYVGLDWASAMHPQTLLCYEMNGEPISEEHGAPLRLAIPLKYGVKNLKRIGKIAFTNTRPADFWAERGYDWYAGF
jgi:hypothetical protein